MGFGVDAVEQLDELAPPAAVAAARVVESPPPRRIELWVVDHTTGRFVLRAELRAALEDDDVQTARASEQLRAFFQPLRAPAPPPAGPPAQMRLQPAAPMPAAPPPPIVLRPGPPPGPPPSHFNASTSVVAAFQPGGVGASVLTRARWMPAPRFGVGALVSAPFSGTTVVGAEGSARVNASLFGVEGWVVGEPVAPLRIAACVGVAAAWVRTDGVATAPFVGGPADVVSSVPFTGIEIAPRVAEHVHLVATGLVGFSAPEVDVVFAGDVVASWGRPFALAGAGISIDF